MSSYLLPSSGRLWSSSSVHCFDVAGMAIVGPSSDECRLRTCAEDRDVPWCARHRSVAFDVEPTHGRPRRAYTRRRGPVNWSRAETADACPAFRRQTPRGIAAIVEWWTM